MISQVQVSQNLMATFQLALVLIAVLTMVIGNLGALGQTNVKRILSYSSIAHVGYMLAALATFSVVGIVAIIFHIWNHGLVKSSFFMLTGNKGEAYKESELSELKGLFSQNRPLGGMFCVIIARYDRCPTFRNFLERTTHNSITLRNQPTHILCTRRNCSPEHCVVGRLLLQDNYCSLPALGPKREDKNILAASNLTASTDSSQSFDRVCSMAAVGKDLLNEERHYANVGVCSTT